MRVWVAGGNTVVVVGEGEGVSVKGRWGGGVRAGELGCQSTLSNLGAVASCHGCNASY
jgi:hypothetical protein